MKKKTVITTEKHEVWIIRQPAGEANEQDPSIREAESGDVLILPADPYSEVDMIPDPKHD